MRGFMRFVVAVLVAVGAAAVIAVAARAEEVSVPVAAVRESHPVYSAAAPLPGRRVESVLTSRRSALTSAKSGTGWLLHSGTQQRDTCDRADATPGLRMMCVSW